MSLLNQFDINRLNEHVNFVLESNAENQPWGVRESLEKLAGLCVEFAANRLPAGEDVVKPEDEKDQ